MAERKNISSGAEKAEKLAASGRKKSAAQREEKELINLADNGEGKKGNSVKSAKSGSHTKRSTTNEGAKKKGTSAKKSKSERKDGKEKKLLKIKRREEHKLERKRLAAERKQKKLEKRLEHREKLAERRAEIKEKRAQRKEERRERRDLIKHESKENRRKRIAEEKRQKREKIEKIREKKLAEKRDKREHRLKAKQQKRENKRQNRRESRRTNGFGGWLAAVISLGVTSLALATALTFGWLNMDKMQAGVAGGYTQSLYELNAIVDDLDTNLARARASSSTGDRVRVFADIAVESQNAELVLERFPLEMQTTERLTSFINDMGRDARQMLYTVSCGGELSARQQKSLDYMYETNAKVKGELNKLIQETCADDMLAAMRGKDCALSKGFAQIQNNVFKDGDSPHSSTHKKITPALLDGLEEISANRAEDVAKRLFADYRVSDARCTGECVGDVCLYNVNLTTDAGEMLVQVSKAGGKVVAFDSFKNCSEHNFSVDRCAAIARDFLAEVGYGDLKPVWASENGTTCNLHFATQKDGVIIYSDLVKVKVCEERGIVTGMDASGYVLRHRERENFSADISEEAAKSSINGNIAVTSSRLAVIPHLGEDRLCYEFFGEMDGVEYYVYVDAQTGEELEVKTIVGTAQGKLIK